MSQATASQALSKYKVLDLTRARAGPTAVRQLADWGAQVIKIELPGSDDTPDFMDRHSPDFQNLHRNKRSMTLNLKHPEGLDIFKQLARQADVIVENYRPDVKHRLGIDYEAIKAINPRIIYGSISGFGQDGPYADRPGVDPIVQGMGGHMMVTGEPGRGPMRSGAALSDVGAGLLCANGILTALLPELGYEKATGIAREALETGKGVYEIVLKKKLLTKERLDALLNPTTMVGEKA